ncbi:Bug family tripartite tricarboxylate transporter substrate binding protein [Roseospira visakhapatnamensis]|uniref:Tripartite-type tricarboxylate transporter receptor subunit TctC n=1 Tax=Roseospira visakhapatnamensis TaxID=390880 RepID=A0A7W6WA68_9PROT|nr:tripartite tricarboxylate transporter substrate binding protein [Roseospira visakhapatnamensis]MBB4266166.1 tripartite-type tricarboxylate transporter receptor subunit TctC [Roseospira visakhapatnamensis]
MHQEPWRMPMRAGSWRRLWPAVVLAPVVMLVVILAAMPAAGGVRDARADGWPNRPVTLIVPSGAGGGTDQTGRLLAERLRARLGQPVVVVNRGQGGGVVGIGAIRDARPDGYTLGILYNFAHYTPLGQAAVEAEDFTAIAQYNADPAAVVVHRDSPWTDVGAALDAVKADPGGVTIACAGGCGGSWPVAIASLLRAWDVDPAAVRMIPSQGAAASLQDLAAGGVDMVPCSLPEARALMEAGVVRGLAVFGAERLPAFAAVPLLAEETGLTLDLGAWRGLVGPAGLPEAVTARLERAMADVVADPGFRAEMADRGFGVVWRDGAAFAAFLRQQQTTVRALLRDLGLTRADP